MRLSSHLSNSRCFGLGGRAAGRRSSAGSRAAASTISPSTLAGFEACFGFGVMGSGGYTNVVFSFFCVNPRSVTERLEMTGDMLSGSWNSLMTSDTGVQTLFLQKIQAGRKPRNSKLKLLWLPQNRVCCANKINTRQTQTSHDC